MHWLKYTDFFFLVKISSRACDRAAKGVISVKAVFFSDTYRRIFEYISKRIKYLIEGLT